MFIIWPHVLQFWIKPNVKKHPKIYFYISIAPFSPKSVLQSSNSWFLSGKSSLPGGTGGSQKHYISFVHDCKSKLQFFLYTPFFFFSCWRRNYFFFLNIPFDFWSGFLEHHCLWSRWHCIWSNINQLSISTSIISQQSQYLLLLMASRLVSINLAWLPITHSSIIEKFPLSLIHPETLLETSRLVLCSVGFKHLSVKKWFLDCDPESSYTNI